MPTGSSEQRAGRVQSMAVMGAAQPPEPEQHLPCPRCESTNTKFCYYNNYNLSQPRHFCKACRRYWTQGGTLRNIPVGGGTRKNSKRARNPPAAASAVASPCIGGGPAHHDPRLAPASLQLPAPPGDAGMGGGFTSLLNAQGCGSSEYMGFGLGLEEMGFGLGRGVWPYQEVGMESGGAAMGAPVGWQVGGGGGGGESGFGDGDCGFPWPELAISMPGSAFK